MKKYCLTLDLQNDEEKIKEYELYHQQVWPEIIDSIKESGITRLEIFRWKNRLFMIMEVTDDFSFGKKTELDNRNAKVQEWEQLMLNYQQLLPGTKPGEKWMLMEKIFDLS